MGSFLQLSQALQADGADKAVLIMNDPLQSLRLELNDAELPTHESFLKAAQKIRALIPHYYSETDQEKALQAFDRELLRAEQAIATGSSKKVQIGGLYDNNGPNLYAPERMLLWYTTMNYMEQAKPAEGNAPCIATLADELARSKGADYLLDTFSAQVTPILAALNIPKDDCIIRWGAPGTHFWHSKKDPEHGLPKDIINFDIKKTLLLGDMAQQVMVHELGHYLYDTTYPPTLERLKERIGGLEKKEKNSSLSEDEEKRLLRTRIEQKLYHDTWNSAADNTVYEGTHRLSSGAEPPYRSQLLAPLLANFITLRGQGKNIQEHGNNGPLSVAELQSLAADPQEKLSHLNNTLFQVVTLIHGQMKSPDDRESFLNDLPKLGIHPELISNRAHPEWSGEQCYWDLYSKCERLAGLTPDPALMKTHLRWREERNAMQAERNAIHEQIFSEYAKPLIEQVADINLKREELRKKLAELLKDNPDWKPGDQPGSDAPPIPGEGIGKPKTVGEHERNAGNGINNDDPEAPNPGNAKPKMGGVKPSGSNPIQGVAAGKSIDAIAEINLGDGRSLEELKGDPLFGLAIDQIKEHLQKTMEQFAVPVTEMTRRGTDRLPRNRVVRRLDLKTLTDHEQGKTTGIPRPFRGDQTTHIPAVGDVILALDTSGSMGWGTNSRAEHVIKASALLALGIMEFNEEQRAQGLPEMGVYIMLWGNSKPTFLGKPYDSAGRDEIILKLDEVLSAVTKGRAIEGAHGGTELEGTFREVLEEYATHRSDSGAFPASAARGPALMLLGSDGGVFDMANVPLSQILQAMPALTVDTALMQGQGSALHQALQRAETAQAYQAPVCVDMNDREQILPGMMQWLEGRMESFKRGLPWGQHYDVFTEGDVRGQAEEALEYFGRDQASAARMASRKTGNDTIGR